jgi:hypothetical protein
MAAVDLHNSYMYDADCGYFISEEHRIIAEIIQDYNPDLYLMWIPPDKRDLNDTEPFAIVHMPPGKSQYVVRRCKDSEVDVRLLEWLWSNDQARGGTDILGRLEAHEAAKKAMQLKRDQEKLDAAQDIALSIIKSPLNAYKHNGVKYQ